MPKHLTGAISLFIGICLLSTAVYFIRPILDARKQSETSIVGEAKGTIRIGGDGYAGYFPLTSMEMKNRMLKSGYRIEYQDDAGDYTERTQKLKDGTIDLAVYTIDSFLLNAAKFNYPGSIIAVISESKGSDAIVANIDAIESIDVLKLKPETKIAYTPASPSHHLLKTVGTHFGLPHLLEPKGTWSKECSGSTEAWNKLKNGEVDVAVLWEPEITHATSKKNFKKLLGTESTSGLIVDILVANRDFLKDRPEFVDTFLEHYFHTLKTYRNEKKRFVHDLAEWSDVSKEQASNMIDGIQWMSLYQNTVHWYGIEIKGQKTNFQLYNNIESTLKILLNANDFKNNPLPGADPRALIYQDFIKQLALRSLNKSQLNSVQATPLSSFAALSDKDWDQLKPIGTLEIPPIQFQSGSLQLSETSKEEMKSIVQTIRNYPNFRVLIEGHTSPRGNEQANLELSQNRAEAVADFVVRQFKLEQNRIKAIGQGPHKPLARNQDESYRAYLNRLGRVEIILLTDPI